MKREWKPGDVAMIPFGAGDEVGMWVNGPGWVLACGLGESWHFEDARPLVVIDPEDREQIERLAKVFCVSWPNEGWVDQMQAALREYANPTPPKPEEPTGLGAVVEDGHGCTWVLYAHPGSTAPWTDGGTSSEWDDLDVVRVLSPGYDPEVTS